MHYYLLCTDGKSWREAVQSGVFSIATLTCFSYSAYSNKLKRKTGKDALLGVIQKRVYLFVSFSFFEWVSSSEKPLTIYSHSFIVSQVI